jgi:hypothetical protein
MPNRRLPRVFGYKGTPPRSKGTERKASTELLQGNTNHEESYALKVANSGSDVITDNLVFYHDYGNPNCYSGSGTTINDLSSNGYTGTVNLENNASFNSSDGAFVFTGGLNDQGIGTGNSYVGTNDDAQTQLTLECFALANTGTAPQGSTADMRQFISYDRSSHFRWALGVDTNGSSAGRLGFQYTNNETIYDLLYTSGTDWRDGNWHQFVTVFTTSGLKHYVDGTQVYSDTTSRPSVGGGTDTETPRFGVIGNGSELTTATGFADIGPQSPWYGKIAIMRYYTVALTASQITQNLNADGGRFGII